MKYGLILHNFGSFAERLKGYNAGDAVQVFAVRLLYKYMGIGESEIVEIPLCDLRTYNSDYVLLPATGFAIEDGALGNLPFSDRIIPVFMSSAFIKTSYDSSLIRYLQHFEPLGCRDEYSLDNLRGAGLTAMLNGCITLTLPKRSVEPQTRKVFLVDVPSYLEDSLPAEIRDNAEKITHLLPLDAGLPNCDNRARLYYEKSIDLLNRYRDEATLVISSRIHALAPCIAMGIPVIAITENISFRFSWIDKFIPIYTPETFSEIDWNPSPIYFEQEKQEMVETFSSALFDAYGKWNQLCDVSSFFECRERSLYGSRYYYKISKFIHSQDQSDFDCIIWGCGLIGESAYRILAERYPNVKMVAAVDRFACGEFHGCTIEGPEAIKQYPDAKVLLCNYSGKEDGYLLMSQLGRLEGKDFLFLGTVNG